MVQLFHHEVWECEPEKVCKAAEYLTMMDLVTTVCLLLKELLCWVKRDCSQVKTELKPLCTQSSFSIHSEHPTWKQTYYLVVGKKWHIVAWIPVEYFGLFIAQEAWADTYIWVRAVEVNQFVL